MAITQQQIEDLNAETSEYNRLASDVETTINSFNSQIKTYNTQAEAFEDEAEVYSADALAMDGRLSKLKQYVADCISGQQNFVAGETKRITEETQGKIDTVLNDTTARITGLKNETNATVARQLKETQDTIAAMESRVKTETEKAKEEIRQKVQGVLYRLNTMRNPLTGGRERYEDVLAGMVELHREDALTATEYGELNLPSVWYDYQSVEGFEYDMKGKVYLSPWAAKIAMLTALEYDTLTLTAQRYGEYALHAAEYDLLSKAMLV